MGLLAKCSSFELNLNFINVFRLNFSYWVILNGDNCWSVSKDSCSHFTQKIMIDPDTEVQLEHMNKQAELCWRLALVSYDFVSFF